MITTNNTIDPEGVDHPKHYNTHPSGVECIEIIRHMTFDTGCVYKYVFRYTEKDGAKDLKKSKWYLKDFIDNKVILDRRPPAKVLELMLRVFNAEPDPKLKIVFGEFLSYMRKPRVSALMELQRAVSRL